MEVRKKGKGRSQNQRLKLFYLLDYLLEHTDETHTVKAQEISEHLFIAQGTVICVNWHKNNRDPLCENSDPLLV